MDDFTDEELLAFIDERLVSERCSEIEYALRDDKSFASRLAELISQQDQGGHTVGQLWRRERLSCPPRAVLAAMVDGRLGRRLSQYLRFHIETVGCRICAANLADLERPENASDAERRSSKIFQSSAGKLRSDDQ